MLGTMRYPGAVSRQLRMHARREWEWTRHRELRNRVARVSTTRPPRRLTRVMEKSTDTSEDISFFEEQKTPSSKSCCYGCGIPLQTTIEAAAGFVEQETFEIKRVHRHLHKLLCFRCQALSNGAMIPGVADFTQIQLRPAGFADPKLLATPEELRDQLREVRERRALVVLLIDLLDASGSMLSKIRDLVGSNPIIAVGTKVDLLPRGADLEAVADWLRDALAFKRVSVSSVHLVSSKNGEGVAVAVGAVRKERMGRDVYVVGAANVGKSAFVRALVRDMASMTSRQFDPGAMARTKRLPVESAMPGTTLKAIPLEVFSTGGVLYDTPGLHLHHRVPHILTPAENKDLHPRKKLRAYIPMPPGDLLILVNGGSKEEDPARDRNYEEFASYEWGGLARVDVAPGDESVHLVFFGPPALKVKLKPASDENVASGEIAGVDAVAFGAESVQARGGLRLAKTATLRPPRRGSGVEPIADIAISGVPGWVAVYCSGRRGAGCVDVRVFTPIGVEVFVRPPLPVPAPLTAAEDE